MTWPWARIGELVVGAGAFFMAGYAAGRGRAPPAEVRTVETVKYQDRIEYRDQIVTRVDRAQVIRRVIRVTVAPDGTRTSETTTDKATNSTQAATATAQGARATSVDAAKTVVMTVAIRPAWSLGVLGGVNAAAALGADRQWWVGAKATHAFVGPLRLGATILERPQLGWQGLDVGLLGEVDF